VKLEAVWMRMSI